MSAINPETGSTFGNAVDIRALEEKIFVGDDKFDETVDFVENSITKIENEIDGIVEETKTSVASLMSLAVITLFIVILLLAAVSITMGVLISRSIARPLGEAVKVAERIAEGDLTLSIEATQKDEIGELMRAMNRMTAKLQDIIGYVVTAAEGITLASDQMSASAQ